LVRRKLQCCNSLMFARYSSKLSNTFAPTRLHSNAATPSPLIPTTNAFGSATLTSACATAGIVDRSSVKVLPAVGSSLASQRDNVAGELTGGPDPISLYYTRRLQRLRWLDESRLPRALAVNTRRTGSDSARRTLALVQLRFPGLAVTESSPYLRVASRCFVGVRIPA